MQTKVVKLMHIYKIALISIEIPCAKLGFIE